MLTAIATSSEKYHIFVPMVDQFEVFIVFFLIWGKNNPFFLTFSNIFSSLLKVSRQQNLKHNNLRTCPEIPLQYIMVLIKIDVSMNLELSYFYFCFFVCLFLIPLLFSDFIYVYVFIYICIKWFWYLKAFLLINLFSLHLFSFSHLIFKRK